MKGAAFGSLFMKAKLSVAIPAFMCASCVFLFGALALCVPSGPNIAAAILTLVALVYGGIRPYPALNSHDRYFIAALLSYFGCVVAANLYHHLPLNSYDNPSRFLLAAPVLLLLLRFPVPQGYFWGGIALGAMGGAVLAISEYVGQGQARASGYHNAIQFGDIAILFACLLLAGLRWAHQHSKAMLLFLMLGVGAGVLVSLLSGARGGWLALPLAVGLLPHLWRGQPLCPGPASTKFNNLGWCALMAVGLIGFVFVLQSSPIVGVRLQDALQDVQAYRQSHSINSSLGARLFMWQSSISLIAERPFLGWGSIANYLQFSGAIAEPWQNFNHVHNEFLDALVKRGILGGLGLTMIYLVPLYLFWQELRLRNRSSQALAAAGILLVVATLVFGLTQTFFSHASGATVYAFMLVILWSQVRAQGQTSSQLTSHRHERMQP
jgi:O-antigen ligase